MIDTLLSGGFSVGLTEICGEAGSGKTQLILQLLLQAQLPYKYGGLNGCCIILNTESQLSTSRLTDMAQHYHARYPLLQSYNFLDGIISIRICFIEQLTLCIERKLDELITQVNTQSELNNINRPVRLLVIDSISALFRSELNMSSSSAATRTLLLSLVDKLRTIANKYNICIITTNHIINAYIPGTSRIKSADDDENNSNYYQNDNNYMDSFTQISSQGEINSTLEKYYASIQPEILSHSVRQNVSLQDSKYNNLLRNVLDNVDIVEPYRYPHTVRSYSGAVRPALGLVWSSSIKNRIFLTKFSTTTQSTVDQYQYLGILQGMSRMIEHFSTIRIQEEAKSAARRGIKINKEIVTDGSDGTENGNNGDNIEDDTNYDTGTDDELHEIQNYSFAYLPQSSSKIEELQRNNGDWIRKVHIIQSPSLPQQSCMFIIHKQGVFGLHNSIQLSNGDDFSI